MRFFITFALCAGFVLCSPLVTRSDERTPGFPFLTGDLANGTCSHPENGAQLVQYFNINSTDTQAALWKISNRKEIVLGIPGSASLEDYLTDLDLVLVAYKSPNVNCTSNCLVHQGILNAWNSLALAVTNGVTDALAANPGYNTTISGHSLGAGIAALAFATLMNGPYRVTGAYTYGQPRTGNQAFANYLDSLSGASDTAAGSFYRVTHSNDSIPQLPSTTLGYRHSRTEYWESAEVANQSSTYRCYGQEPFDCVNSADSALGILDNPVHGSYTGFNVSCG
ncbi:hypothetical protein N7478_010083 [Penicillium angulare]|uniref:uncharacterized protein n=1 Tax=Penicillium angulare TaxID=116970 RepID=UPI00253FBB43|nr:uncharacterized protein N7478_010083 [Penicillium angulare]KAJ5267275.1 hypothetical protein N7478_010083 [Penicillium angulare]